MVAEATLVAVAIIGAEGLDTSVFFVLFKEEWGIIHESLCYLVAQSTTDQHVVDALPAAFVAVGTFGAMSSYGIDGNVI